MKISVITVAYNAAGTIGDTIASVVAQDYPDYEHIIVDGASTDGTLDVVSRFQSEKLRVFSEKDAGIYDAMGKGLSLAAGDLVGFLNSDDYFCRTDALSLIAATAAANPDAQAVAGGVVIVDKDDPDRIIRHYSTKSYKPWMLRYGHMPPHPGLYVRAAAAASTGTFKTSYRIAGDFDWIVRFLLIHGFPVSCLDASLVTMRSGGASMQGFSSMRTLNSEVGQALRENGIPTPDFVVWLKYPMKLLQAVNLKTDFLPPIKSRWPPFGQTG